MRVVNQIPPAFRVKARAQKLAKMDAGIGKKSDPFFKIYESSLSVGNVKRAPRTVYRSEVIKQSTN